LNLFFETTTDYYTNRSVDSVQSDIKKITTKKWKNFSENITGTFDGESSFKLSQKWSLIQIGWFESMPSYISGTISIEGNKTKVTTSLRPNPMFVLLFYTFIVFFICELFGVETFLNGSTTLNLISFTIFTALMYFCIRFFTARLKKRFERLLKLG
jgi:hypothetical protein